MALVYVTDDEPNICKLVAFGLKDEGFETATFTDGNSLLEAIQKRKPDAIILDWMMPPPDGCAARKTPNIFPFCCLPHGAPKWTRYWDLKWVQTIIL